MRRHAGLQGTAARRRSPARRMTPGVTLRLGGPLWAGLLALCLSLAPVSGRLTEEDQATLIDVHNSYRGIVQPGAANMMPMRWDENLRVLAESYAVKCIWGHNPDLEELGTGENLYTSTGPLDIGKAMHSWYNEYEYFSYHNTSCQEDRMCGHYTQIVWAHTTAVGCAVHRCDTLEGLDGFEKANLLVCNYSPPGNYEDQLPYEEGEPCSKCPENHQRCQRNLCMPDLEPSEEPDTPPASTAAGPSDPPDPPPASTADPPPPASTPGPYNPADTEGPAPDPAATQAPTPPEREDVTEAGRRGQRPGREREEPTTAGEGAGGATPALLLTSALVLLSLGALGVCV